MLGVRARPLPCQDCVATHDKMTVQAVSCGHLAEVKHMIDDYDVIGVDEGQFFEDVSPEVCQTPALVQFALTTTSPD